MNTRVFPTLPAVVDPDLKAVIRKLVVLHYATGERGTHDFPPYVRSASAVRRLGLRLVIVQDDVNVLALRDEQGQLRPLLLPLATDGLRVFDESAGTKHLKMDLEACVVLPDSRLVAFGSGSGPMREGIVIVDRDGEAHRYSASALYSILREERAFSGSGLNIEGAVVRGNELLLFQRGNAAPATLDEPTNAIGSLWLDQFLDYCCKGARAPHLRWVLPVNLGQIAQVKLGFTDAAMCTDGRIAVLACAEDSPDAVHDGPVIGSRVGLFDGESLQMCDIRDGSGRLCTLKLEGIEQRTPDALEFHVVADMDRPTEPALAGCLDITESGARHKA